MTRSPCINHPDKDVIDVPPGSKYCTRCRYLIAPELEIAEIIEETPVEAEPERKNPIVEELKELEKADPEAKPEVKEQLEESPEETVQEEAEELTEEEVVAELLNAEAEAKVDNTAEIARLKAQLAELEQ